MYTIDGIGWKIEETVKVILSEVTQAQKSTCCLCPCIRISGFVSSAWSSCRAQKSRKKLWGEEYFKGEGILKQR